jgi:hypothetical protein
VTDRRPVRFMQAGGPSFPLLLDTAASGGSHSVVELPAHIPPQSVSSPADRPALLRQGRGSFYYPT